MGKGNYKRLGDHINEVNVRNTEQKAEKLLGINIDKFFMPSVANIVGTDLSVYRLVRKNQFACNRMHVGRDYRLPISMSKTDEEFMVSPAYDVFEIKDTDILYPEYLMMWFTHREFDRNAWFYTDADVRGGLHWNALCDMQLPIPSITKQKEIVKEYNVIQDRIALNQQLIQKLEETAQAIYKQWFVDFEFPNENGNPYKSNGGEMVESESGEIPKGWRIGTLENLYKFQYGMGNINPDNGGEYPVYGSNGIIGGYNDFNNDDSPVIGHIGANCGSIVFAFGKHFVTYNGVMCIALNIDQKWFSYLSLLSKDLMSQTRGSSQPFVSYDMLYEIQTIIADETIAKLFDNYASILFSVIHLKNNENQRLSELKDLLLSKLATVKD
jgi:type I restriction enzyme S subunit